MWCRLILFVLAAVPINGQTGNFPDCKSGPLSTFPICNPSVTSYQRAVDLVSRMTTSEKITQLNTAAAAIPRLGIPAYQWVSEALHGIAYSWGVSFGGDLPAATSFPMPINLAATFNMSLIYDVASVISTEARAFNNEGRAGLNFLTPNINIFRDPRWGRGQETPGEDPFLVSQYVYNLIRGLQGDDKEPYLKVAADCKHFDAYDLDHWNQADRAYFDAQVSDQDLVETFLPPFESCIRDAQVASIMCSLNAINGVPSCASKFLLQTIARESYHLNGFVVADCEAVSQIMTQHHYTSTVQDTIAAALHAGTDIECGSFYTQYTQDALNNQTIVEADIDQALHRTFNVLVRVGWFDPPEIQAYRQLTKNDVDTTYARQLSLRSAQESIVLLKNVNNSLPLHIEQLSGKTIALIGPTANATILMQGDYYGQAPFLIDPLTAFKAITQSQSINVSFAYGCPISNVDQSGFAEAIALAKTADIVFFFGGLDQTIEHEALDRTSIALPEVQLSLLLQIGAAARSPVNVVMMSGSSLDLSNVRDEPEYGSLIWMGYAGQAGGYALSTVVFGQYNPAGRLPITFYPASYTDAVSMTDMQMRPSPTNPGRTYKFYTGEAAYEFGSGLSYTTFAYSWSNDSSISSYEIQSLMKDNYNEHQVLVQQLSVNVTNTGTMDGDDVVLAFIRPPQALINGQTPPIKQLCGFKRVHLNVNETAQIFFLVTAQSMLSVAQDGSKWFHPGQYHIDIGKQHMHTIELQGTSTLWPSV